MPVNNNITVEDSTPTFPKVLTIVSTGGGISSGVRGVKGDAEQDYRDGYVNITPANIGFTLIEVNTATGTLPAASLKLLKDNLQNLMGYETANGDKYVFRLATRNSSTWIYSALKLDLTGSMFITLNITTGEYAYTETTSETQKEVTTHVEDADLHVSQEDRANWDSKVTATVEDNDGNSDDKNLILS